MPRRLPKHEVVESEEPEIVTENPTGFFKAPKARTVIHVRTHVTTQIGAFGSSLDASKNNLKMELRPDLGGVLVCANFNGKEREFLVPFSIIAHSELAVEVVDVEKE